MPVQSGIAIRVYRHVSQDLCPWNQRFASELAEPAFAARDALRGHAAWALARLDRERHASHRLLSDADGSEPEHVSDLRR